MADLTESGGTNVFPGSHLSGLWGKDGGVRGDEKVIVSWTDLAEVSHSLNLRFSSVARLGWLSG